MGCTIDVIINEDTIEGNELKSDEQNLELLYQIWSPSLQDYIYYCDPPAFRCLSEVIITPPEEKSSLNLSLIYQNFLKAVEEKKTNNFFKNLDSGCLLLFPYLEKPEGQPFLGYLQDAEYEVIHKFNPNEEIDLFMFLPIEKSSMKNFVEDVELTLQVKNNMID